MPAQVRHPKRPTALVTDPSLRTALSTVRNLGQHAVQVTTVGGLTPQNRNLAGLSRYVDRHIDLPDVHADPEGFAEALLSLAVDYDVLFPIGMHSIRAIGGHVAEFAEVTNLLLPPLEKINLVDDTGTLLPLAEKIGIRVPRTFDLEAYSSFAELAEAVSMPCIVKIGVEAGLPPRDRYRVVRSRDELETAVRELGAITPRPLIQELIQGQGVGFSALYDREGHLLASFTHRRLREYPPSGGPSTYCESCHITSVADCGRRLLDHVGWTGLAMVEFKMDAATGVPVLMEINPRPWGSMVLAIKAGIEFPWLAYQAALGYPVSVPERYPDGVRLRFFVNDAQAVFRQIATPGSLPDRVHALASLFDPRVKEGVLSWRDHRPSLAYLGKAMRRALRLSDETLN